MSLENATGRYPQNSFGRSRYRPGIVDVLAVMDVFEPRFFLSASAGIASQVVFTQQPSDTTAGSRIAPIIVEVEDSAGNIVTQDRSTVTLSLTGDTGVPLQGAATAKVKGGRAIFKNLSIRTAGAYSFEASGAALTPAISDSFTIDPGSARKTTFSVEPIDTIAADNSFSVELRLLDRFGNVASDDSDTATIALGLHPKGAALSGVAVAPIANGLADFDGLSLETAGNYTLKATVGQTKTTSTKFVVVDSNSFIVPYTARVLLTPIGGTAGATTEFGLGTSESNADPLFTGLPDSYGNYGPTDVGIYKAGESLDVYMKTTFNGATGWAFSDDTSDAASRTAFMDLDNSLGLGGNVYQKINKTTYVMHLDDALSYLYDDNDSDVLIRITLAPVYK